MCRPLVAGMAILVLASHAFAAWSTEQLEELDTVLVTGEQPGPGLWKVSRDDNVMWVLASTRYRPGGAVWSTRQIDARLAESREVLLPPQVNVEPSVGFFKMLSLVSAIPAVLKIDKNPGGAQLQDLLPPDIHARWLVLRDKYYVKLQKKGNVEDVEKTRPAAAIMMLQGWATVKSGLRNGPGDVFVTTLAQKHNVPIHRLPAINRAVKLEGNMRHMLKDALKVLPVEDVFRADGHIEALRKLGYTVEEPL